MSQPSFELPEQLRYDLATSSHLGTIIKMVIVTPYTWSGAVTIHVGKYFKIYVAKSGSNTVFHPINSCRYLWFKLKLANATGSMTVTPAGCIDSIFRRLDVYHESNICFRAYQLMECM